MYARETTLIAKYPDTVKVLVQVMVISGQRDRRDPVRDVHGDRAFDQEE